MLNFLPRDEKYFERFNELAVRIHEAAQILERFFQNESPVATVADQVKRLEHECDEISHEILRSIDRTFITPIDREDIHRLAVRLDDVIDLIDGTIRRVLLFRIEEPTKISQALARLIVKTTGELVDAVSQLRKQKAVMAHCIRIKQLENEGDVVYHDAIASLFSENLPAIEVIKWKEVYDNMERCIDSCVAVAHVLESVVLKHFVTYVLLIIAIALVFDFINGMHDSANSIATVVSTRVLSPFVAVFWAAFFNFVAAFVFGTAVAKTIGSGLIDITVVNSDVVLGGLIGAIAWNLITWYFGIPSSSSHALIGGYAGAAVAKVGVRAIIPGMAWVKTLSFIVLSPLIGMAVGFGLMVAVSWTFHKARYGSVDRWFRRAQLGSAAAFSLSHGTNDAQKTMGIIGGLLVANHGLFADPSSRFHWMHLPDLKVVPWWIILSAHAAIGLGTLTGGWRIVRTMGTRITKLKPFSGFCAETSAAGTVILASVLGIPVSTTHTITGSIIGVGATQRFSAVRWGVAGRIVYAWVLTIPMAATIGALSYGLLSALTR